MLGVFRAQHENELEQMRNEHAAEIINLLESLTSGNWEEALDVARDFVRMRGAIYWLL